MLNKGNIWAPIVKSEFDADKGVTHIYGRIADENLDADGQRTDLTWFKSQLPAWEQWSNIREMHQGSAVGVRTSTEDHGDSIYIEADIVDADAQKKVLSGVYKGLSYGVKGVPGNPYRVVKDIGAPNGRICGGALVEVSLCDRPALPEATFTIVKNMALEADAARFRNALLQLAVGKTDYAQDERDEMAKSGQALPDGSYPIKNKQDVRNAISDYNRSADKKPEDKAHIIKRARALGIEDAFESDKSDATKMLVPESIKGEPDPNLVTADTILENYEMDDAQLFLVAANIVRYIMLRKLHEQAEVPDEDDYNSGYGPWLSSMGYILDQLLSYSKEEADESWEALAERIITGLATSHTLEQILADAMDQAEGQGAATATTEGSFIGGKAISALIGFTGITKATKNQKVYQAIHKALVDAYPGVCPPQPGAPEGETVDKTMLATVVKSMSADELKEVGLVTSDDFKELQKAVTEMGHRVQVGGPSVAAALPTLAVSSELTGLQAEKVMFEGILRSAEDQSTRQFASLKVAEVNKAIAALDVTKVA